MKKIIALLVLFLSLTMQAQDVSKAEPVRGIQIFYKDLINNLKFDELELNSHENYYFKFKFQISEKGQASVSEILNEYESEIDLNLLKNKLNEFLTENGNWKPAVKDGIVVSSVYTLPLKILGIESKK